MGKERYTGSVFGCGWELHLPLLYYRARGPGAIPFPEVYTLPYNARIAVHTVWVTIDVTPTNGLAITHHHINPPIRSRSGGKIAGVKMYEGIEC